MNPSFSFCPSCGAPNLSAEFPPSPTHPAVTIKSAIVVTSAGGKLDVKAVAKKFSGAEYNPSAQNLIFRFKDSQAYVMMRASGQMTCGAQSVEEARRAIEDAVDQIRQSGIKMTDDLAMEVRSIGNDVNYGRAINIQLMPERLADSMYAGKERVYVSGGFKTSVNGSYNRGGVQLPLSSDADVANARKEIMGSGFATWDHHVGYCKIPGSSVVAFMLRGVEKDGSIGNSGYAILFGAKSETEVRESAVVFGRMLEQADLFGAPTPTFQTSEED